MKHAVNSDKAIWRIRYCAFYRYML